MLATTTMSTVVLSIAVIALAVASIILPHPLNCVAVVALAALNLIYIWTHRSALRRVAQGVSDRLDDELSELIAEVRRRRESASTD